MEEKTKKILALFYELSQIPRCSKQEAGICRWLIDWAGANHFEVKTDAAGNIVMRIPASRGYEKAPVIVIQGHVDMVCEKTADSTHDFATDPIELVYEGDWLTANQTTLGADNGIGIALALALAGDDTLAHPALELLFTVDEETGLTGAQALAHDFMEGRNSSQCRFRGGRGLYGGLRRRQRHGNQVALGL